MYITFLLLGVLLLGLIILAVDIFLLLKLKNKLAGLLAIALGLVLTLANSAIFLELVVTTSVQG